MPPKLSLKRKAESKSDAALEQPPNKTLDDSDKTKTESNSKSTKPKLKVTLAPLEWKGNKLKRLGDQNQGGAEHEWRAFPPSNVLKEIYAKAHANHAKLN